jgi:hypothetical protein
MRLENPTPIRNSGGRRKITLPSLATTARKTAQKKLDKVSYSYIIGFQVGANFSKKSGFGFGGY